MDVQLRERLRRLVAAGDDPAAGATPRLADDAERLWKRVRKFAALGMADMSGEADALELACFALQLPLRQRKPLPAGKLGRTSLKDRAEQAAELLVSQLGDDADEALLDRATRVLHELPQRSPVLDAARLLADAVNLDDFGVSGLLSLIVQLGLQGGGLRQLADACEKREQYGYWDARLRDGFHFDPVRQIARRRLDHARGVLRQLADETREDEP